MISVTCHNSHVTCLSDTCLSHMSHVSVTHSEVRPVFTEDVSVTESDVRPVLKLLKTGYLTHAHNHCDSFFFKSFQFILILANSLKVNHKPSSTTKLSLKAQPISTQLPGHMTLISLSLLPSRKVNKQSQLV